MAAVVAHRRLALTLCGALLLLGGCGTGNGNSSTSVPAAGSTTDGPTTTAPHRAVAHRPSRRKPARRPSRPRRAVVGLGRRTKTSGCQVRGQLPDPACTPGGIFPLATVTQICQPGYSAGVRNVSVATKRAVYAEYGATPAQRGAYEVDHLVPLEVGGNNSIANLWPEIAPGYHAKDRVENELHDSVCSGRMALRAAQVAVASDWRHAGVAVPSGSGTQVPATPSGTGTGAAPSGSAEGPGSLSHAGDARFCSTHRCIANFPNGHGTVVQCADGEWSHSGGLTGVCNRHGGPR